MGIRFAGHPDLRRILMPAHWPNHPLRKDMPLGGEEVPFTLTWSDPEFATLGKQILPAESLPPDVPPGMNRENMIINMGPHHPSTHGVLRLVVELDGETVINVDPDLGYLHSGFEKTGENKRYKDFRLLHRPHGLSLRHEQQLRLCAGRGEDAGARDPAARPGDPRHHGRAAAHRLAPLLALHPCAWMCPARA